MTPKKRKERFKGFPLKKPQLLIVARFVFFTSRFVSIALSCVSSLQKAQFINLEAKLFGECGVGIVEGSEAYRHFAIACCAKCFETLANLIPAYISSV